MRQPVRTGVDRSHNPPELTRLADCCLKGVGAKLAYRWRAHGRLEPASGENEVWPIGCLAIGSHHMRSWPGDDDFMARRARHEGPGPPFSEITQTAFTRTGLLPVGCSHRRASEPGIGRTTLRSWALSSDPHIHLFPRANADSFDSSATSCCQPASGTSSGQPPRPSLREPSRSGGHGPALDWRLIHEPMSGRLCR